MTKRKILIQLDPDPQASVFDAVVAIDAGADQLLQYAGVQPEQVRELVHGAMFTRGPQDLSSTAIFIGGSNVAAGEALLERARSCFFGPLRVSILLDASGANTTAAAAVLAAGRHAPLKGATAVVLAATGPVGQRAARLLAREGALVRVASRSLDKARALCATLAGKTPGGAFEPWATADAASTAAALEGAQVLIAAGAAGVELVSAEGRQRARSLRAVVDLNAVPPVGIAGVEPHDKGTDRDGAACYGALGVGGWKMKIHRAAITALFGASDRVLDAEEVLELGRAIVQ